MSLISPLADDCDLLLRAYVSAHLPLPVIVGTPPAVTEIVRRLRVDR